MTTRMTTIKRLAAFALGALLYVAEECLIGYSAAVSVPKSYFDFFGTHKVVALTVEEAILNAVPACLLALGWSFATMKAIRMPPFHVVAWVTSGLVLTWFGRSMEGLLDTQSGAAVAQSSSGTLLWSFLVPPIWAVLTSLSAPLGIFLAGLMARGSRTASSGPLRPRPPLN